MDSESESAVGAVVEDASATDDRADTESIADSVASDVEVVVASAGAARPVSAALSEVDIFSDKAKDEPSASSSSTAAAGDFKTPGKSDAQTNATRDSGKAGRDFGTSGAPQPTETGTESQEKPRLGFSTEKLSKFASNAVGSFKLWGNKAASELRDSGRKLTIMKQKLTEQLGKADKTVDHDLQKQILAVREIQGFHKSLVVCSKQLSQKVSAAAQAQVAMAGCFTALSTEVPELSLHYEAQSSLQDLMAKNTVVLVEAVNIFQEEATKFAVKQINATLSLVRQYEEQRLEYDATRGPYESLKGTESPKLPAAETKFLEAYNKLSQTRDLLASALKSIQEEKVSLMKKQLTQLHNAFSMYISGNQAGLEEVQAKMREAQEKETGQQIAIADADVSGMEDASPFSS